MVKSSSPAKSLLDKEELAMFTIATGVRLQKLTKAELEAYVGRSRVARDKWVDLSKKQRRGSQSKAGQRQTSENARSDQKVEILRSVHQAFVDRLAAVDTGAVSVPAGTKAEPLPRKTRKVINRVDRAIVRQEVAQVQEAIVVKQRTARKQTTKERAVAKVAAKSASESPAAAKATKAVKATKVAKNKPVKSKKVVAAAASKAARDKAAAKRASASAVKGGKPIMPEISKKAPVAKPQSAGLTRAQIAANRSLGAKASKNRVAIGGNTRIKSHVASANRRKQTRRDSK